jgi:hypothetical protein
MDTALTTHQRIGSLTAHGDDLEMHHLFGLRQAAVAYAMVASDGEASTLNYSSRCLC